MNGKSVNFGDKKNKKRDFSRNKKVTIIDEIHANKKQISKKELYGTKNHWNTLLDTMIMMLLDHYV